MLHNVSESLFFKVLNSVKQISEDRFLDLSEYLNNTTLLQIRCCKEALNCEIAQTL